MAYTRDQLTETEKRETDFWTWARKVWLYPQSQAMDKFEAVMKIPEFDLRNYLVVRDGPQHYVHYCCTPNDLVYEGVIAQSLVSIAVLHCGKSQRRIAVKVCIRMQ